MTGLIPYVSAGLVCLLCFAYFTRSGSPNLDHIPCVGKPGWLASCVIALRYLLHSREVTKEGYDQARNGMFKIPFKGGWMVYCCGRQLADDLRRAKDDELSLYEALNEIAHMKHSLGEETFTDPYHVPVIRTVLTKNLAARFPDMQDEIVRSFRDVVAVDGNEWKAVPAMDAVLMIVSRVSSRIFVGMPLCRNQEYLHLTSQFTVDVMKAAFFLNLLPKFLKNRLGNYATKLPYYIERMSKLLRPIFEERLRMKAEDVDGSSDKPNDYITWLLNVVDGNQRSIRDLTLRVLAINFGAIHTSSAAFTHALYDLAVNAEYVPSLREEIEGIVKEYGWTKAAIDRMTKVDSFLRESQRIHSVACMIPLRKAVKDFTFSNGLVVPGGTLVSLPMYCTHRDETLYAEPDVFDPYRFARIREELGPDDRSTGKYQMVSSNTENLTWGLGRHVCPGRYFATVELKAMLAHVIVTYDVKMEDGVRPADIWVATVCAPSKTAKVLFRKR